MFIRRGIKVGAVLRDSRRPLALSGIWTTLIVYLHDILGYDMIALPTEPVATVGIVVSLYLGFKTTSAYNRWWEARSIWGEIVNNSRSWANSIIMLVDETPDAAPKKQQLIKRHIAWVVALSHQLRKNSVLKTSKKARVFNKRLEGFEEYHTAQSSHYRPYLIEGEFEEFQTKANPAVHILRRQGQDLATLYKDGKVDNNRLVALNETLAKLYDCQGKCERIKNTPFPRQITIFGRMFSWVFIFLLPLAFIDLFEQEAAMHNLSGLLKHEYVATIVPFCMVISLIFYLLEKVSESVEDPFEWGMTDVPIATLSRVIEIDLLEMLENEDDTVPEPLSPINGVLY